MSSAPNAAGPRRGTRARIVVVALLSLLTAAGWWQATRPPRWRQRFEVRLFKDVLSYADPALAFSPDGRMLAVAVMGHDKPASAEDDLPSPGPSRESVIVAILDPATGGRIREMRAKAGELTIDLSLAFTPDGRTLLASYPLGGLERAMIAWDPATGRELARFGVDRPNRSSIDFAVSPGGHSLLAAQAGALKAWDTSTWRVRDALPGPGADGIVCALAPDGARVVHAERRDGREDLTIREIASGRRLATLHRDVASEHEDLAFSPDGRTLAIADYVPITTPGPRTVHLWDTVAARTREFAAPNFGRLEFSPDGRSLLLSRHQLVGMCSGGNWHPASIQVWDVASGTPRLAERIQAKSFGFAPAGTIGIEETRVSRPWTDRLPAWAQQWIAKSRSFNIEFSSEFLFLDAETGRTRSTLGRSDPWGVKAMAVARGGKSLATASADRKIVLWDANP